MKLSDYQLEKLAQGELPQTLAQDPDVKRQLEELKASNEALLARHPPEQVAREIERRRRAVVIRLPPRKALWVLAPVAAVLLVIVFRPEQTDVKGDAALLVYRDRGGQTDLLSSGATAKQGDVLQLAYIRATPGYGAIVSIDGSGNVTQHLPDAGSAAAGLTPQARTLLPHAYELDAAPKFERFFLVTSGKPFAATVAVDAARQLARRGEQARTEPLQLPREYAQTSFLVIKP
jgi:hypothetical protein